MATIKAPISEVLPFVNYHLNIGFDHLYLFFDDPDDPCITLLAPHGKLTCIPCDQNHWDRLCGAFLKSPAAPAAAAPEDDWDWLSRVDRDDLSVAEGQNLNAKFALQLAREHGYGWLGHIDGDELIDLKKPLEELLSAVPNDVEVLALAPFEAVPERSGMNHIFEEVSLFKTTAYVSRWRRVILHLMGIGGVLAGGYYKAHCQGKSLLRTGTDVAIVGCHRPTGAGGRPLSMARTEQARLLHFDCCDYETWLRKWSRRYDGSGKSKYMGSERLSQFKAFVAFHEAADSVGLARLHHALYFFSGYQKLVLMGLGLLKRIKLDPSLFAAPGESQSVTASGKQRLPN